jgi:hypothetical protein
VEQERVIFCADEWNCMSEIMRCDLSKENSKKFWDKMDGSIFK